MQIALGEPTTARPLLQTRWNPTGTAAGRRAYCQSPAPRENQSMVIDLHRLSGEELLLLRVLHGESIAAVVERELDRRAVAGPPVVARASGRQSRSLRRSA